MRSTRFLFTAVIGITAVPALTAQTARPPTYRQILEAAYPADGPGATAIVARGDQLLFLGAVGMADLELGVPLAPDMVFEIGSITKQFTATAIMLLADAGKLSVSDPITRFLPDYPGGAGITIEHLLTHSSGIVSYTNIPGYMATEVRKDVSVDSLIAVFKDRPVEFRAGERLAYNNSGYILLGAIIERASGQSYEDFVEQHIFAKLGMSSARYGRREELVARRAAGYVGRDGNYANAPYLSMTQPYAAGALMMNIEDLWRWNRALHGGRVVSRESYTRMTTPFVLINGDTTPAGFGLALERLRDTPVIRHGGGIFGYVTDALYIPSVEVFVAVFSNNTGAGAHGVTATRLAALALGTPYPQFERVTVDPAILERYTGVFRIDSTSERSVWVENGQLMTQRTGGERLVAVPASETHFFYPNALTHFEFVLDRGRVIAMLMHHDGSVTPERAEKIADRPRR